MDLIVMNGTIYTLNGKECVEALGINDGKIIKVGMNDAVLSFQTAQTTVIDLKGQVVIPGFNDSHLHLYSTGLYLNLIDVTAAQSLDDVKQIIKEYINTHQVDKGTWLRGRGWNQDYYRDKKMVTKADLDDVSPDHPLLLYRTCGHVLTANSRALDLAEIAHDIHLPDGSINFLTGIVRENAINLLLNRIPDPSLNTIKQTIEEGLAHANRMGITSLQTDDLNHLPSNQYAMVLQAFIELAEEGKLTCRIYQQAQLPTVEKLSHFLNQGYTTGVGNDFFKIGPLKLLSDGSLGARTAALTRPYEDDPETRGMLTYTDDALYQLVHLAHSNNMQVAIHAIGDRAVEQVLSTYERVLTDHPRPNHRHAIVHSQIMSPHLIEWMKQLEVLALVQPIFINDDQTIVQKRIHPSLLPTSYAYRTMHDVGIHLAFGTDSPVETMHPFNNIYCAVTRGRLNDPSSWQKEQSLTVDEAIRAYTTGSAYASFEETTKGMLKEGFVADFIVLDCDPYKINPTKLKEINVVMTIVNGKIVYNQHKLE